MNKEKLFQELSIILAERLHLLSDKPEESIDSTLKSLWLVSAGMCKSVEEAVKYPLPELTQQQIIVLRGLIEQRISNIPLSYIIGRQSFMGIEMLSDKRALIPRKETEILGRKALALTINIAQEKSFVKVLDICCGAGNLGLALASYNSKVVVSATDLSEYAINLTLDNIEYLNLSNRISAYTGDLFSAFETEEYYDKIDVIVCNPPYISSAKVLKMDTEISENEPALAFDGGMLGTKIILRLISEAPKFLTIGGWLIFEIGVGQGQFIKQLCERSESYTQVESVLDDFGNIRVILAQKY